LSQGAVLRGRVTASEEEEGKEENE